MTDSPLFRFFASSLAIVTLAVIYLLYMGVVSVALLPPIVLAILSGALLGYAVGFHSFETDRDRLELATVATLVVIFSLSGLWIALGLLPPIDLPTIDVSLPRVSPLDLPESFLPDWWLLLVLVPAGAILLIDSLRERERPNYSTPSELSELAETPIYFGAALAFLGFWGVLFVGFNVVQRIVVVAPIFEEFLKFGVAILVGAALFGRSMASRVAVALVVGSIFGLVEHTITYAGEPDVNYLFRVLFHMITTTLTVAVYTMFEERDLTGMLWVAPTYPILLHFANNAFVVVAGILMTMLGVVDTAVPLVFGAILIVLGTVLLGLAILRHRVVVTLHRPIYALCREIV